MTINYNCTGVDRKKLVASIAEITGADSKYLGAPTFAYQVDYFTIDRNGVVTFDDRADSEEIENLLEKLDAAGFHAEPVTDGGDKPAPTEMTTEETSAPHSYGLTITLPANSLPSGALANLTSLLAAKGNLIRKSLGVDALPVEVNPDTVSFPWFENRNLEADEVKTYTHFIAALCDMARNQKRITAKEKDADNEKYAFRCFLLRLGFIGAEYKTDRKILLRNLSGNSAFKSSQRSAEVLRPEPPNTAAAVPVWGDPELFEALADEILIQQVNASFDEEDATDAFSE
jgi:hypothetical protein